MRSNEVADKLFFRQLRFTVLVLAIIFYFFGCTFKESQNSMDPANICGGISASDVGIGMPITEFRNGELLADGIHFDLYAVLHNCTGKELQNTSLTLSHVQGLTVSASSAANINLLKINATSDLLLIGSFIWDLGVNSNELVFEITDGAGEKRSLSKSIDLTTIAPSFMVATENYLISDGASVSNGDTLIDPGEKITFTLNLTNLSMATVKSISTTISSSDSHFVIASGSAASLGDIGSKLGLSASAATIINVEPNTPRGTTTTLLVTVTDQFNRSWQKSITLVVSPTVPPPRKTQVLALPT